MHESLLCFQFFRSFSLMPFSCWASLMLNHPKQGTMQCPQSQFSRFLFQKKLKLFQQIDFWTILKLLPYLKKSKSTLTYPRSKFRNSPSFILFSGWPLECLDVLNICHFFYNQYTVSIMLLIGSDGLKNPKFNLNMPFLYCWFSFHVTLLIMKCRLQYPTIQP